MVNWPAPGGDAVVACSVSGSVEPSGRVKVNVILSPFFGGVAPNATEIAAGEPAGPVTVVPVSDELTLASLKPNGEPATSSDSETVVPGEALAEDSPKVAGLAVPPIVMV